MCYYLLHTLINSLMSYLIINLQVCCMLYATFKIPVNTMVMSDKFVVNLLFNMHATFSDE